MTTLEQRHEIKDLMQEGKKAPEIAELLGVSVHTVRKWQQRIKKGELSILS